MKSVGIIGGIGPESTIDYYRLMLSLTREQTHGGPHPSILINSIDVGRMLGLIAADRLPELVEYLGAEIQKLASAGASFGLIAANTPHIVFEDLCLVSTIPLISIVQSACDGAKALGLKKLGLFGTRFTMQGDFYPKVFSRNGLRLVPPGEQDQAYIHEKYMNELLKGQFLPETQMGLLRVVDRLKQDEGIDGLILAGTELPLILRDAGDQNIPFLDTTQLHVQAAVRYLLR